MQPFSFWFQNMLDIIIIIIIIIIIVNRCPMISNNYETRRSFQLESGALFSTITHGESVVLIRRPTRIYTALK